VTSNVTVPSSVMLTMKASSPRSGCPGRVPYANPPAAGPVHDVHDPARSGQPDRPDPDSHQHHHLSCGDGRGRRHPQPCPDVDLPAHQRLHRTRKRLRSLADQRAAAHMVIPLR
jgi:hypothetical protein